MWKRSAGMLLLIALFLVLTACGGSEETDGDSDTPLSGIQDTGAEEEIMQDWIPYSTQGVSFNVPASWSQAEGTDLFYTESRREIYGLNGVSPLGSYTPQEFFASLVDYYQTSGQFDSLDAPEEMYDWQFGDDVACQVADLVGDKGSVLYCTKLVVVPQKNLVLTFCGQAYKEDVQNDPLTLQYILNGLCDSLDVEIGSQDYISGNTFLCGDGSQLCLQEDGGFRYYQSAEDHERQYYEGVYEVYYGQPALEKIASMTEYGLTIEELERTLSANMNGYVPGGSSPADYLYSLGELEDSRTRYDVCLDTFYAVILHNQRLVHGTGDVEEGGNSVLYLGFYIPELKMADLTNANAASYTQWTFQEKTA